MLRKFEKGGIQDSINAFIFYSMVVFTVGKRINVTEFLSKCNFSTKLKQTAKSNLAATSSMAML